MTAGAESIDVATYAKGELHVERVDLTRGLVFRVRARVELPGVVAHDYYDAAELPLARAIFDRARERVQVGERPELHALAAELKARDARLVTRTRAADGAVLLGDTPPDEQLRR